MLTPYRPAFLALTTASLAYTHRQYRDRRRTVLALALAVSLAGTPELVHWYNKQSWCWPQALCAAAAASAQQQEVHIQVNGLTCVSCAMRLKQRIQQQTEQQQGACQVDFPSGSLKVTGRRLEPEELVAAIIDMGYEAKVIDKQKQVH